MSASCLAPDSAVFLDAILRGDRHAALGLARRHLPRGILHLYDDIVAPALREVGVLWQQNRICVADEHLATAVAQSVIAGLYAELDWPADGPRALIACVEGEGHDLGARMVADALALDGWEDRFLGADVHLPALVQMVVDWRPVLVALSITLPGHLAQAADAIRTIRAAAPDTRILVGGRATTQLVAPAAELGADAWANSARGTLDVTRSWKPPG